MPRRHDETERELRRVAERIIALGPARLVRASGPGGATPEDRVRALGQHLADAAADLEGRPRRDVPRLAVHGLADQLVVLARDLLLATDDPDVEDDVHDRLVALRRSL